MKAHFSTAASGLLAVIAALFCANSSAVAGLAWAETFKSIVVESGSAYTTYGMKNNGPDPVRIVSVNPSCNCVSAYSIAKVVKPGQAAEIVAVFHGKNHLGSEERRILVVSVSGTEQQVQSLALHVSIQPDVVLDPPRLTWARDEPAQAKVVRVKESDSGQAPLSIMGINGGKPGFTVTTGTMESDPQFSVTPESTTKPERALIRVTARKADKSKRELIIYAIVRP